MKGTELRIPDRVIGSLVVLFSTVCWGTSGIFVKFVVADSDISALALAFWRDFFSFLVLLVGLCLFGPQWLRVERQEVRWLAAMGCVLGIFHVFWNLGVLLNGAAVATVQQAAMPAIVTLAAWMLWHEPLTWIKILAIILTFVGTVLVSGVDMFGQAELSLGGMLVGLGMPVFFAGWNLLGKKVRQDHDPFTILVYAFGFGALVLLPFQFFIPQTWPVPVSASLWFVALILIATVVPFSTYTFALGRLPASVASILAMSEIPIVAVYAYLLLGEQLAASQVVGAALVMGGVLLLTRRPSTI